MAPQEKAQGLAQISQRGAQMSLLRFCKRVELLRQENTVRVSQGVSARFPALPKLALTSKTTREGFLAEPGTSTSRPNRKQEAPRQVIIQTFGWLPKLSTRRSPGICTEGQELYWFDQSQVIDPCLAEPTADSLPADGSAFCPPRHPNVG